MGKDRRESLTSRPQMGGIVMAKRGDFNCPDMPNVMGHDRHITDVTIPIAQSKLVLLERDCHPDYQPDCHTAGDCPPDCHPDCHPVADCPPSCHPTNILDCQPARPAALSLTLTRYGPEKTNIVKPAPPHNLTLLFGIKNVAITRCLLSIKI